MSWNLLAAHEPWPTRRYKEKAKRNFILAGLMDIIVKQCCRLAQKTVHQWTAADKTSQYIFNLSFLNKEV